MPSLLQIAASNQIQGTSYKKSWNKLKHHSYSWFPVKIVRVTPKSVRWFCPPSNPPNWTSRPKLFSRHNFFQACLKKHGKLFALPKFGSLQGSPSASFKIFRQTAKIWQIFETGAHICFSLLVYRYLLLLQTKLALVRPSPNIINFLELINNLSISNKGSHSWPNSPWLICLLFSIDVFFQPYFSAFYLVLVLINKIIISNTQLRQWLTT